MDFLQLLEPYIEAGPIVLMAVSIAIAFVTGWVVSKPTHEREIEAHAETKAMLKEAIAGWKDQTKATRKANYLVQRVVDALRLRDVIEHEDPDL